MFYIKWTFSYSKLLKIQFKIRKYTDINLRQCRNLQRLLRRSHLIQLLIINEILQFQIKKIKFNIKTSKEKIFFYKLIKKKYRNLLNEQITQMLWILAFSPIIQQKRNSPNIYSTDNRFEIYKKLYEFLNKPSINYIFINQFSNSWNLKYKSNILIEKKFFFYWLNYEKKNNDNTAIYYQETKQFLNTLQKKSLTSSLRFKFIKQINNRSFKKLIINFVNLNFLVFFENTKNLMNYSVDPSKDSRKKQIIKNLFKPRIPQINSIDSFIKIPLLFKANLYFNRSMPISQIKSIQKTINKRNFALKKRLPLYFNYKPIKNYSKLDNVTSYLRYYFFQYNNQILIALENKKDVKIIQNNIQYYAKYYKLDIFYQNFFNIHQGLTCLGWFLKKKKNKIYISISQINCKNHQNEIQKYLKTTKNQSVDKIIYELNKKIISWQKFYGYKNNLKMNNFLFWRIWYWTKKRHKNKSAKWLYKYYWKKSKAKSWIFSMNNETLILYKN